MTHDFTEQVLREQLHAAAEGQTGSYADIDPLAALDAGQRAHRRRRRAAVAGTAAATLVLAIGGWAVLSDRSGDDRTLPATTPSSSPSATIEGPTTEVRLGAIPPTGRTESLVAAITVDEAQQRVAFTLRGEDGTVLATQAVPQRRADQAVWTTLVPGVTLASLPVGTTSAVPLWTRGALTAQGSASAQAPDGRVFVVWWTNGTETDPFAEIVWTDGDTAYTAAGYSLPTVVGDDLVYFVGGTVGLVGYLAPPDGTDLLGGGEAKAAEDMEPGVFPAVWADDPAGSSGTYVTYLPPVKDVELVTTGDARVRDMAVHDFGDIVGLLVVAHVDGSRESVTAVTFTDPDPRTTSTSGPAPAD